MKSLIQEASSLQKAIEKAWVEAGMPSEFKVKVFNAGSKGFLGILGKPAVVSIIYDPRKMFKPKEKQVRKNVLQQERKIPNRQKNAVPRSGQSGWSDAFIDDIKVWLKEITDIIGIKTFFELVPDKLILNIAFKGIVLNGEDEERMLFASLSSLLLQILKKKYKRKLLGYKLIFSSQKK
jgi:predicted RNA-binding protein Jag